MAKKKVSLKLKPDYLRIGLSGGVFTSVLFFAVTLLSKFDLVNANILFDLYGKAGYDMTIFGIILGIVYGFATGFALFTFYAWCHSIMPKSRY